jgi:hypothetical protein
MGYALSVVDDDIDRGEKSVLFRGCIYFTTLNRICQDKNKESDVVPRWD